MSLIKLSYWKKLILCMASIVEVIVGLLFCIYPEWLIKMLFGADVVGAGIMVGPVAGIALISLGVGCWRNVLLVHDNSSAILTLTLYSILLIIYFVFLGLESQFVGVFLWPAVIYHGLLTGLLAYFWVKAR